MDTSYLLVLVYPHALALFTVSVGDTGVHLRLEVENVSKIGIGLTLRHCAGLGITGPPPLLMANMVLHDVRALFHPIGGSPSSAAHIESAPPDGRS